MRSINLKNVAAVVTGVAMAGSVIAPALATVDVGEGVNEFVQLIKENPEDTYAIVGSLADVSDAIAAADFVDALRETTAAESEVGVTGEAGGVTIQTQGGTVSLTPKHYDIEFVNMGANALTSPHNPLGYGANRLGGAVGAAANLVTITPDVLPGVLTRDTIEAYVQTGAGATLATQLNKFEYEEQVLIGGTVQVRFDATDNPAGHGIYIFAPSTVFTPGAGAGNQIAYALNFMRSGNGLPMNNTTYTKTPVMKILKKEYAMDVVAARTNLQFVLYPGEAVKMHSGETYTTDDGYVVTLEDVGLQGTTTARLYANVKVESPDGEVQRLPLQERQGGDYFGGKITAYVDWMTGQTYTEEGTVTGRADIRIGHGRLYFDVGRAFPLDDQWTVTSVQIQPAAGAGAFPTAWLQNVTVRYGSPVSSEPKLRGEFAGNEYTGLKQGIVLDGPMNYDGTPVFNIQLSGFGGATPNDVTEVILRGAGVGTNVAGAMADTTLLQATYTDRGGLVNKFEPSARQQVVMTGTYFPVNPLFTPVIRWGMVSQTAAAGNYHTMYYDGTKNDGAGNYWPVFKVGGVNGVDIGGTQTTVYVGGTGTVTYTDIVGTFTCPYVLDGAGGVTLTGGAACNGQPAIVYMGSDLVMDRGVVAASRPFFDASNITVGRVGLNLTNTALNTSALLPMVRFFEWQGGNAGVIAARNFSVIYDSTTATNWYGTTSTVAANTGLAVANTTIQQADAVVGLRDLMLRSLALAGTVGDHVTLIDTTQNPMRETDAHHITVVGSEIDTDKTTGTTTLTIKTPEATRNTLITVAEVLVEGEDGAEASYGVGDVLPDGSVVTGVGETGTAVAKAYKDVPAPILDSQATGTYQVVVGGPWVNTVSQGIAGNEVTTVAAGTGYLIRDGNKVLAAGKTGTDTSEALQELFALLETDDWTVEEASDLVDEWVAEE